MPNVLQSIVVINHCYYMTSVLGKSNNVGVVARLVIIQYICEEVK